jgi:hypothetical protein
VLGIIRNLEMLPAAVYCKALINALLTTMYSRFNGLLQLVQFKTNAAPHFQHKPVEPGQSFNDPIYLVAPLLDPTVKHSWIDAECGHLSEDERNALKENVQQLCLDLVSPDQETSGQQWQDHDSESNNISQQSSEDAVQPATKKKGLCNSKHPPLKVLNSQKLQQQSCLNT